MSDLGRRDDRRVSLADERDAKFWSDRFDVTTAQLEEAVAAVGDDVNAVHAYLRGQGGGD